MFVHQRTLSRQERDNPQNRKIYSQMSEKKNMQIIPQ